jgi:hypothetical protein
VQDKISRRSPLVTPHYPPLPLHGFDWLSRRSLLDLRGTRSCAERVLLAFGELRQNLLAAAVIEFRGPAVGVTSDSLSGF